MKIAKTTKCGNRNHSVNEIEIEIETEIETRLITSNGGVVVIVMDEASAIEKFDEENDEASEGTRV